ncbi:XdhC family protein [Sorangium sp. So ce1099]|uniref:XdhC family protein n=1 Tax=Sorangium sp. So ce1099 TaxID=3133331 RepID=UPI003F61B100
MPDLSQVIPRTASPHDVLRAALGAVEAGRRVVLASVVARHGSAPSTPGQKLCLFDDLTAIGTIGGGAVERAALGMMGRALDELVSTPKLETFRLGPSLGMCCGGSVEILLEPMLPAEHVLVIGAGHVGAFAAPLLASLGFRVTLCDARAAAADPARVQLLAPVAGALPAPVAGALPAPVAGALPAHDGAQEEPGPALGEQVRVVLADHDDPEVTAGMPRDLGEAAALVMTHDHGLDQAAIEWALARGFGYVGGVGSRAKAARTRARLEAKGVAERDVARVRMPIGLDIGARTPAEISVALAAELVAWRAGRRRARWMPAASAPAGEEQAE